MKKIILLLLVIFQTTNAQKKDKIFVLFDKEYKKNTYID